MIYCHLVTAMGDIITEYVVLYWYAYDMPHLYMRGYNIIERAKEDTMSIIHITDENFQSEVMESSVPVLVDFWATWCAPCRMIAPHLEAVAQERPDIKVCKVNVDEQPALASSFNVMSIPMLVVIKDGKITNKSLGLIPKERILELL